MTLSIISSALALLVLIAGEVFGRVNVSRYKIRKTEMGSRDAFLEGSRRKSTFSTAALFLLVASSISQLLSDTKEVVVPDQTAEQIRDDISRIGVRLKRVEDQLWPPTDPGGRPIDPKQPPPFDPSGLHLRIDELNKKLDDISAVSVKREELEEIREEIIRLKAAIDAHRELIEYLESHRAAPAG